MERGIVDEEVVMGLSGELLDVIGVEEAVYGLFPPEIENENVEVDMLEEEFRDAVIGEAGVLLGIEVVLALELDVSGVVVVVVVTRVITVEEFR